MLRRLPKTAARTAADSRRQLSTLRPPIAAVAASPSFSLAASSYSKRSSAQDRKILALRGQALAGPRHFTASTARHDETVKVPQMAESISEGTLKQWLKKPGDFVKADEEVATIETDKIDVSVNAPQSGTITETLAEEEDTVTVGQDLFKLEPGDEPSGGGGGGGKKEEKPKKKEKKEEKPKEDEGKKDEGKDEGKEEKKSEEKPKDEPAESEADAKKKEDDSSPQPQPSKRRGQDKKSQDFEKREVEPDRPEPQQTESRQPEGRKDYGQQPPKESPGDGREKPKPFDRTERRVKMNRMRVRISERLKQSQNTAASLTTFNEIDMSSLMEMRKLYKDEIQKEKGIKIGFMSAFAKAATLALKEIPAANASIEGEGTGDTILYRDYVDLSVAVATPKGLVTPVVRNAESLGFVEIEQEIANLGKKARDGKLTLEDMSGGSFTISNGGVFGSLYGTPIINLPQTAVLGMHAIKETPVVRDGQIVIRPIMIVALTYDHRLLDGREAVTFLVKIKQYIEDPRKMLLA